ncbi:prenyltransferase/squalene oxidase repeat-containing protein [Thermogemmata fonticola]|uniref:Terpene cyclase/mutase family protein n=1 Tax=Thermogemmata fonticola TaxID=2755323 RepID=A0A7V8VG38_9BACT|nr:prenyltransferase/squalene oxidase repeat-containing protein [Thermogemmata fonticola]MBA2227326.1 terpene cyclase/mutase family protein [Thermogemmata fonticola]
MSEPERTTAIGISRRQWLKVTAGALAGSTGAWLSHAQPPRSGVAGGGEDRRDAAQEITSEVQEAIDRGLEFLARNQNAEGSFVDHRSGSAVGITSLAALALMAGGHQPGRGRFGNEVLRAAEYVASMADGPYPGFLTTPESQGSGRLATQPSPMYSHGFGTLFLAEVCGMMPTPRQDQTVRAALEKAVAFTIAAQNKEGGWRYEPRAAFADVSVTVAHMMALRAAKNAGLFIRKSVIDAGVAYIKACQVADGGFSYWKGQGHSAFARSAAAIVGLYSAGLYQGGEIERGLKYLLQFLPGRPLSLRDIPPQHYWYGHYYAALAMWTARERYWNTWFPAIRQELLHKARTSGGLWLDPYHGAVYATAMALIILQLPNNYLPILQR